jgi:hypothetical protein
MSKKRKQEPVKQEKSERALAEAKETVVKAEKVAEVAIVAAEAIQEHVVQPVSEVVKLKKKPRFVRQKKERRSEPKGPTLQPRSTKATAKLMTRGIVPPPKDEKVPGCKPKT